MFNFIGLIFGFFKKNTKVLVGLLILLLVGGILYMGYSYGTQKEQLNQERVEKAELISNQVQMEARLMEQQDALAQLRKANSRIEQQYSDSLQRIQDFKRLPDKEVKENGPEIEKQLNQEFRRIQNEIRCATGDAGACK